ncbi:MAG: hypothetical protein N3J91_07010 [Verrucomicrobiae bacterium]|nr:hypothetical protein [Verrucomicrobiae bacterium]
MNTIIQLFRILQWYAFTETRCAWCRPYRRIRRAWLWPKRISHGMCHDCFVKLISNPN